MPNQFTPKRPVIFPIGPSIAYLQLTQGLFSVVDWDDALHLQDWNWMRAKGKGMPNSFYACREIKHKRTFLHQILCPAESPLVVDHKNRNTLDNRRANLRAIPVRGNAINRRKAINNKSGFKGVYWNRKEQCWRAAIGHQGKMIYLGSFSTPERAHEAYKRAAKTYHGEFACFG